jgi:superfamily II DNA or RNA helicase
MSSELLIYFTEYSTAMAYPFVPRKWQEMFVRDYQTKGQKNYLLEACTSAGKTGGAIYAYVSLKNAFGWDFLVAVVPSEHLKKQYSQDAMDLFGLNFHYSGTDTRLRRLPNPDELLKKRYDGIVISYQWLTYGENAEKFKSSLEKGSAKKVFLILDEVHHASSDLAFGQACENAFPDHLISHRLMTSGTPFRSDKNRILGNWIEYKYIEDNVYQYQPDFCYSLLNALNEGVIPHFSFVTLAGEFAYRQGEAVYEGKMFSESQDEQELTKLLNTAIYVDGEWVQTAIEWAHKKMKMDRRNGYPECATYIRVPRIETAFKMKQRIYEITGEDALIVVSQDDPGFDSNFAQKQLPPSTLIEDFSAETGHSCRSWIIGVGMLGEGVSIKRLKYRIHATNIRARLSFMQDLGRLLRKFPDDNPQPVETLIPAHPYLKDLALNVMNQVAEYFIRESEEESENDEDEASNEGDGDTTSSAFQPISSTGEFDSHIVDGEEISNEYTAVAEWAIGNHPLGQGWGKTPAHLAQVFQQNQPIFQIVQEQYQLGLAQNADIQDTQDDKPIPLGFSSKYNTWLPDKKTKYASKEVSKKAKRLAYLLLPKNSQEQETDMEDL